MITGTRYSFRTSETFVGANFYFIFFKDCLLIVKLNFQVFAAKEVQEFFGGVFRCRF